MSQQTILRKEHLRTAIGPRTVSTVDVREIAFAPGQQTGRHYHPCPVVGYIAEGAAILQIEGRAPQSLPAGSASTSLHKPSLHASTTPRRPNP